VRRLIKLHQPKASWQEVIIDLVGSAAAVGVLALITDVTQMPLLWAPFGGTLVLIFAAQRSPYAQPINVLGGHLLAASISLVMVWLLPHNTWTLMLTVGVVIAAMRLARVTHPPAGANPIVIFIAQPTWWIVLPALAVGALAILLLGYLIHRMTRTEYPLR
jgi:CBS-domain-containing membrane protein